jgi:hypothetical protein
MESKSNAESLPNYFGQAAGWKGRPHEKTNDPSLGYLWPPFPLPVRGFAI